MKVKQNPLVNSSISEKQVQCKLCSLAVIGIASKRRRKGFISQLMVKLFYLIAYQ